MKPGIGHVHIAPVQPGPTGGPGPKGERGPRGASILSGSGAPSSAVGVAGDFYIDADAQPRRLYGPRSYTAWPPSYQPLLTDMTPGMQAAADSAARSASLVTVKYAAAQTAASIAVGSQTVAQAAAAQADAAKAIAADHAAQTAADKAQTTHDRLQVERARDLANLSATIARQLQGETTRLMQLVAEPLYDWSWDSDPSSDNDWSAT
ncbi:hypothetical protein [Methylobacterium sp. 285MFTsu5.1]|uniref:hypothetical protein n=1 Tax=Methylobacterium sp. 285MFTsu5.1 TaxID=1172187 RepID=UPI00131A3F5F|nr:hypothetical protein [Methylobacterium sp. 285MFTsu5.1]